MIRYTLKEMTDLILSSIDGDEVDSILDTVESTQVALLIKSVYYDLATDLSLPEHETLFELNATSSATPGVLEIPDNVTRMDWFKYDNQTTETHKKYLPVDLCSLQEFLSYQQNLTAGGTNIESMTVSLNSESHDFLIYNDRFPTLYTVIGDKTIICNAYHSTYDTDNLLKAKTQCHGIVYPTFTMTDAFAVDLDPTQFSLLINRSKVRAFAEIKQAQNVEAAGEARRQSVKVQKFKRRQERLSEITRAPKYGRK